MLSVVLPAYNEARRLPQCLNKLGKYFKSYPQHVELIVVDNGSTDNTAEIADAWHYHPEFVDTDVDIRCIRLKQRGKGLAVRAGMLAACGDYRLMADIDLSTPPRHWEIMIAMLKAGADIVTVRRYGPGAQAAMPLSRKVIGLGFQSLARLVTGNYYDTQCGFKAFRRMPACLIFSQLQLTGWAFDVEVLYLARRYGLKVEQVPLEWRADPDSRVRLRDSVSMAFDVLRIPHLHRNGLLQYSSQT